MSKRVHRFTQGGVQGAAIQVAETDTWDLNQMLTPENQLSGDAVVPFTYACAYLEHGGRRVMVDGGWEAPEIVDALAELGVKPGDIELVLITHGDGDHILGLLTEARDLTYPNAKYVMHQELWDHWHDAEGLTKYPEERCELIAALAQAMEQRLTLFHDECEVSPRIRAIPCLGHREGHCTYEFVTEDAPIHHFGDTLFHPLLAEHPEWLDMKSLDPPKEAVSRRRTLERAATSGALVLACHILFPGVGRVESEGAGYRWIPVEET